MKKPIIIRGIVTASLVITLMAPYLLRPIVSAIGPEDDTLTESVNKNNNESTESFTSTSNPEDISESTESEKKYDSSLETDSSSNQESKLTNEKEENSTEVTDSASNQESKLTNEKEENSTKESDSSSNPENKLTNENEENSTNKMTSVWGDVQWEYEETSGVLTFTGTGTLGESTTSPWNRTDDTQIDAKKIGKIVFQENVMAPKNSAFLFNDKSAKSVLNNVTSIVGIEKIDTSNVTSMESMFSSMSGLTSLDVTNFNTSNVTSMQYMFSGMSGLTSLDVTNFNTSNVTGMQSMFSGMSGLTSLDVTGFNTSNVIAMNQMFYGMRSLTSLDVTSFDTRKVTLFDRMFMNVKKLAHLDVSKFVAVGSFKEMFSGMNEVTKLDVSGLRTNGSSAITNMFSGTKKMSELKWMKTNNYYFKEVGLPDIISERPYTGNWINADTNENLGTSQQFMKMGNKLPQGGTYKWETGDFLELDLVLDSINFETTLKPDGYLITQYLENSSIEVYNSVIDRNWSVKATMENNELTTDINGIINNYSVMSFQMNNVELIGTGVTGIVAKSHDNKTEENNTGSIGTEIDTIKIEFSDATSNLKVGQQLNGKINYQLYNTAIAE